MDEKTIENIVENNLSDHLIVSQYDNESFEGIELCLGIDEGIILFFSFRFKISVFVFIFYLGSFLHCGLRSRNFFCFIKK